MHEPSVFLTVSRRIMQAYNRQCEPILETYGLPQVSFDILMFLSNHPENLTAQEICEIRHIRKNLVSVHVEKLVSAGLLSRSSVEGDRRKIALSPTERAEPIIRAGHRMQESFFEALSVGIDEDMRRTLEAVHTLLGENAELLLHSEPLLATSEILNGGDHDQIT